MLTINKTGYLWLDFLSYIVFGWQVEVSGLEDKPILDTISAFTGRAFIKFDQPLLKFRQFYQTWAAKVQSN
ncbi:MAG: hypothetical protein C6Y22_24325 [Hapalosiphonaceae cyanobacterium JJU2]|nr:MAG: hypothetical protein C6Y22_24325 [Hapalosiphonaceae cyanobacterium JJU2]